MKKTTAAFEIKKINMETLPEYLVAAREGFSYTKRHVAKITNISEKFLDALEQGYYHRLPADVYVYGFLRRLAELYMADDDLLIFQYKKERGIQENLNRAASGQVYQSMDRSKLVLTPKTITLGAVIVFILGILGYLGYQVHSINQPPAISIAEPSDGSVVHTSSIVIRGQTEPGATLTINDQPVLVDSSGGFKEPLSLVPGQKVLTFISKNNFGKENSRQISIIADFQNDSSVTAASQASTFNLTVQIGPNPTWVSVKIDDQPVQYENLNAGDSKTFTGQNKILVSTGDAGSTSVLINNKSWGKMGRDGEELHDIPFTTDSVNK